jgi:predicted nucleic acid-binding protein
MASSPKRVCWDACAWIALINKEKIQNPDGTIEDRYALCRSILNLAERADIEVAISGLCLVEVCKAGDVKAQGADKIAAYFQHDYILLVPVDSVVGSRARALMFEGHPGLKPPDATHVATALISNADELHTFDDKLLNLDELLTKADGTVLKICKPGHGGPALPLLPDA